MNQWKMQQIKNFKNVKVILGQSPPSKSYNDSEDGLPFLQGKAEFGMIYPTPEKYTSSPLKIAEKNDILISVRAPVGDVNLAPYKLCIGRGLAALKITKDNPRFYFYWFQQNQKLIENMGTGSTFKAITGEQIKKIELPIVNLPEQKTIAEILSTVDEAIQKADEAIKKTERIKQGVMHKLLTEGIGHKEFKQTKIGKIPRAWEVKPAKEICSKVTDGTHDSPKATNKGYLLYTSKNIKQGKLESENAYLISKEEYEKANRRSKVDTCDVLFSMIGTIGEAAIVFENPVRFAIKNVGLFKTDGDSLLSKWLYYYFSSQSAKNYILGNSKGTTQKYIPLEALRDFPIFLPDKNEQQIIIDILSNIDSKLDLTIKRKNVLERIKLGLMNDLLTGKKRVRLN